MRSLRIFTEIYPEYDEKVQLFNHESYQGWVMPYIQGREANDQEIAKALVDIFQRTGRIVLDAPAKNNFISTFDGKIICIDVGFAFRLKPTLKHSASQTSLNEWSLFKSEYQNHFFQRPYLKAYYPQTIAIIKALLFLQNHLAEFKNLDFLYEYPDTARYLASIYEYNLNIHMSIIQREIQEIIYYSAQKLKLRCIEALMDYLKSRCLQNSVFEDYQKKPSIIPPSLELSWMSYLFRNHVLTTQKIHLAQTHIGHLLQCQTIPHIRHAINQLSDPQPNSNLHGFPTGLFQAYLKCKTYYKNNQEYLKQLNSRLC